MDSHSRLIALAALLACHGFAHAQVSYSGTSGSVSPQAINSLSSGSGAPFERFMRNVTGTGMDVVDRNTGKIGTKSFPVELARNLPKAGIASAIGASAARIAVGVAVGGAVALTVAAAYCKYTTGSWLCDPGLDPESNYVFTLSYGSPSVVHYGATGMELYVAYVAYRAAEFNASNGANSTGYSILGTAVCGGTYANACSGLSVRVNLVGGSSTSLGFTANPARVFEAVCPTVGGFQVKLPNGKCVSGTWAPATEQEVADRVAPQIQNAPQLQAVVQDLVGAGIDLAPYAVPKLGTLSGPASVTQDPSSVTTTSPSGTPQTTTTTTTNNITYNQNTFTWNSSTTTVKPDGTTETETETPDEKKSECEKNPDVAGCQKLDVPDVSDLQTKDIPVTWSPDAGWGADNASCPAASTVSVLGQSIAIDNTLFCTFFGGIRFVVIGIAAVVGAFIFIGGVKQ